MTHDTLVFLGGGGEMGKLIRSMDWSQSPLGPTKSWPQSLRTAVSLCLASNFPISLAWGPKHIQIYNDGYWPICGDKHPHAMGQDFSQCWASAWPAIGEAFERALSGETSYLENQRMFLDRNGYLEETFFTFSFSPIRDESGCVGGLFHPVTEQTGKMLSERRTGALRDLSAESGRAKVVSDVFVTAAQTLSRYDLDLPFVLFYLLDGDGTRATLVAHAGLRPDTVASPSLIDLTTTASQWSAAEVMQSGTGIHIDGLAKRFGPMSCGRYPETPKGAFVLPICSPGSNRPMAIFVAGVSPRLPLDAAYRAFFELLGATVATAVANTNAYEDQRRRAEALAELDRAKTAFFSNVSHEFRTPLWLMLGPVEDALGDPSTDLPAVHRGRLEVAHRNALRLLKLVNMLLDFSRIEAGRAQASFEPIDLAAFTAELASNFRSACDKAGLRLVLDCPPLQDPVFVDAEMWEKIVLNLISNAFKFTFEGEIAVSIRPVAGDLVELAVHDTGIGISRHELSRLFERFHRIEGAQGRSHEGSGIGLALVQELVKLHGGTLVVESEVDRGSIFRIRIPFGSHHLPPANIRGERTLAASSLRASAFVEEALRWLPDAPGLSPALTPSGSSSEVCRAHTANAGTSRPRIVLADDNADIRAYVSRILEGHGYQVHAVGDGEAALAAARQAPAPDLVLTDVMMPRLDGFGLLKVLRDDPAMEGMPVIMLSARAGEESRVEGLGAGADDYLVKPFGARELLARVDGVVRLARMRRRAEQALHEANERLESRVRIRTTELEATNKDLERFAYAASHDLKAPLRVIDNTSKWLEEDLREHLTGDCRENMQLLRGRVRRMEKLLDDLLEYSRIGRSADTRYGEVIAGDELMKNILELLCPPAGFTVALSPKFAEIRVFRMPLQQILMNLVSNAIKHHDKKTGHIEAMVEEFDSYYAFTLKDDGPGIPAEFHDQIFGMFQTLRPRDQVEGSGMGLAMVRKNIDVFGGTLDLDSGPGRGSSFRFTWPKQQKIKGEDSWE